MAKKQPDKPQPADEQNPTPSEPVEQEMSLEQHLQGILDQIEDAEPGLMEAEQLIGDDGKPRFIPKPKPKPKPVAPAPKSPSPPPPAPSASTPIEEDELAALINQAIDQASKPDAVKNGAPAPSQIAPTSDAELSRAVDRDIDQAVQQAAHQPLIHSLLATFDPASNFTPIQPNELGDAIEEAFANPQAPHLKTPPPEAPAPEAPEEITPPVAQAAEATPAAGDFAAMADDAKVSNDDLDALFAAMSGIADTSSTAKAPQAKAEKVSPPPPAKPPAPAASADTDKFDRMSNDDLDALFADPSALLAEHEAEQAKQAALEQEKAAASSIDSDFMQAWDQVLDQAQMELARIADEKLARQAKRQARKIEQLKLETKDEHLDELLKDENKSVFEDAAFAQQWDTVINQAREQLGQLATSDTSTTAPAEDAFGGGKLSNDDLTEQLDSLLAQVQADSEKPKPFEALDEAQLTSALDTVLGQAMNELVQLASEKLKNESQKQAQKIQTIRESLTNDELAGALDQLITQSLQMHAAGVADDEDQDEAQNQLDESQFASEWETVLSQAMGELDRLTQEKMQRKAARVQAAPVASVETKPQAPAASHQDIEPCVDLASELDALFSSALDTDSAPDKPAEKADSHRLTNDELAGELENLLREAVQQAAPTGNEPAEDSKVTESDIEDLINAAHPTVTRAAAHDPAVDEPQDPAAMITHIDSLLAEHASEAVEDRFETPEQIAEHGLSEEELEAAFQSPEEVLQNLQEASQTVAPSKPAAPKPATPKANPPRQTTQPKAPAQSQPAQEPVAADPEDLEGYFEAPDALDTQRANAAIEPEEAVEEAQEAVEVGTDFDDEMMGDFVSPDETSIQEASAQPEVDDDPYESVQEVAQQAAPVAAKPAKAKTPQPLEADQPIAQAQAPRGPGRLTRIKTAIKPISRIAGSLAVQLANQLKHMGPVVDKACALINGPMLRLSPSTRNLFGYIGLVNVFLGVILFCVFFKKMLFGV